VTTELASNGYLHNRNTEHRNIEYVQIIAEVIKFIRNNSLKPTQVKLRDQPNPQLCVSISSRQLNPFSCVIY